MWLKYRHTFSYSSGTWEWREIPDVYAKDESELKCIVEDIESHYDYSDKYRGLRYEVVDKAPHWVIYKAYCEALDKVESAQKSATHFHSLLQDAEPCVQCQDVKIDTPNRLTLSHDRLADFKGCPSCGREVDWAALPYILQPLKDQGAVKLLKMLVKLGKSKETKDWPQGSDKPGSVSPIQKLIDYGLAGGCSTNGRATIWEPTDRGREEVKRQAAFRKSKR